MLHPSPARGRVDRIVVALLQAVEMGMEVRFNDPRFADVVTLADMVKAKR